MNNDTPADAITQADIYAADREAERIYFANSDVLCERDHEIMKVNLRQAFARHRTTSLAAQDGLVDALRAMKTKVLRQAGVKHSDEVHDVFSDLYNGIDAALASIEVKS